jgi:hypothetical protein
MITSNVLTRVFQLKYDDRPRGTCFTVDRAGRQYIVTAAHCVPDIQKSDSVAIFKNGEWLDLSVNRVGTGDKGIDIAVLAPAFQISPTYEVGLGGTLFLGQDVFFLGFPYGLQTPAAGLNRGFDFPLVKKATISSLQGQPGEPQYMLLDGISNPGFSGGPVACPPGGILLPQIMSESLDFWFVGVISSYRVEWQPGFIGKREASWTVRSNTGIILAYDIKHALDMIDQNPIGVHVAGDV